MKPKGHETNTSQDKQNEQRQYPVPWQYYAWENEINWMVLSKQNFVKEIN